MRIKKQFTANGSDGKSYEIYVVVPLIDTSDLSGKSSKEGLPDLRTLDGLNVYRIDKGCYQIVETGVFLKSSDPNAC